MSQVFFAPNSKNTGGLLDVKFNSKDANVYLSVVKQNGWDANRKVGAFKDGARIAVKLSIDEVANLIRLAKANEEWTFYHSGQNGAVSGQFRPYRVEKGDKVLEGMGLSVKKGEEVFKVALNLAGVERLIQYLEFGLWRMFEADYAADKKAFEDRMEKEKGKKEETKPRAATKPKKTTKTEPEDDGVLVDEELPGETDGPAKEDDNDDLNWD